MVVPYVAHETVSFAEGCAGGGLRSRHPAVAGREEQGLLSFETCEQRVAGGFGSDPDEDGPRDGESGRPAGAGLPLAVAAEELYLVQTAMIELSPAVRERVHALFRAEDVADAQRMITQCTDNAPYISDVVRQGVDRIVFAMIRLSGGRLDRLENVSIPLFRADWRDLLVAADFAEDVHAHETWHPRRFDSNVEDSWTAGHLPRGVEFGLGDSVVMLSGRRPGRSGVVIGLLGLEPEPRYLVELGSGTKSEESQRMLKRAG